MPYSFGLCLSAEVGSDAVTCPIAPDPASLSRWASTLPDVIWLRTPLPYWSGLQCRYVSRGSRPHFLEDMGSGTATCPKTLDPASQLRWAPVSSHVLQLQTTPPCRGWLWRCHVSYGTQWDVCLMNKEKHNRSTYVASLACFQHVLAYFQGAWH
jgi:hypothetical protein